ncbi:MAG: OmpA family protein [Desulfatibacillum sp.]|nr:OmpA family protein [Desulfatibacillum sp.]
MKNCHAMILALILSLILLPACSTVKDKQATPAPTVPRASDKNEGNGIGQLIEEYEGVVVAKSAHATLIHVDQDLDHDGVVGRDDKCPGTPQGAPVDGQGCWDIPAIHFELNSMEITPQGKAVLDAIVPVLANNPVLTLSVEGHTCNTGDPDYNKDLSLRRAQAVKDYLVSQGVGGARMAVTGYGSNKPVKDQATRAHRIQNRRVEIVPIRE